MKISIIVPIYNSEETLSRCIDSILSQEMPDWELLLIEDGSKDRSLEICRLYESMDTRIHVFSKKNGGVSSARNLGLDNAQGDWVTFVDSDDYIDNKYFDFNWEEDLLIYNLRNFNLKIFIEPTRQLPLSFCKDRQELEDYVALNMCIEGLLSPCAKFFKRNLIGNQRFLIGQKLGEDTIFIHEYLKRCNTLRVSNRSYYYYYDVATEFCVKYKMPVKDSINQLNNIYKAYCYLGINNQEFVSFELELFRKTCAHEIYQNSRLWYCNKTVKQIYKSCANYQGWKGSVKYSVFQIPCLYRFFSKYLK